MTSSFPPSTHEELKWSREITGTGGSGIADLAGYKHDLDTVDDACRRVLSLVQQRPVDHDLVDLIWTAAVVNYARYHSRGARQKLSADLLDALSPAAKTTHERLLAVRDKHIAHSVNSMETNLAMYELSDPASGTKTIVRIGTVMLRRSWDYKAEATALIELSAEVRTTLEAVTEAFHKSARDHLETRDIDELYAEPPIHTKRIEQGSSLTDTRKNAERRRPNGPVHLV